VKPERKKGSSFAILARIDHVRFVSVRGEGAVETVSVASYEKKRISICRYTSSERKRKRKNPLGPVPSSVFASLFAIRSRPNVPNLSKRVTIERGSNADSRTRESLLENSFPRERRCSVSLFSARSIDPSIYRHAGRVERNLFSCKVLFRSRRRDRFFKAATHCESGVMRREKARKRNDDASWSIPRIPAESQTLA